MGTTHTQALLQSLLKQFVKSLYKKICKPVEEGVGVECIWTIKVKDKNTGLYVPVHSQKNKLTSNGLSNLAAAWGGNIAFVVPQYLVIDQAYVSLASALSSTGLTSFQTIGVVDIAGDTQIILGAGTANQETVTFTSRTGSGPFTYNLSTPTTKTHLITDPVLRQVNQNDTMSSVGNEMSYDASNDPGHRALASSGYSQGIGNWTVQFFLTGTQALGNLMTLGLSDSQNIGSGILHNHCILGASHLTNQDIEIDASLTITNI